MAPIKHTHSWGIAIDTPLVTFPPFCGWEDKVFFGGRWEGGSQESEEDCNSWYHNNHQHHLTLHGASG